MGQLVTPTKNPFPALDFNYIKNEFYHHFRNMKYFRAQMTQWKEKICQIEPSFEIYLIWHLV